MPRRTIILDFRQIHTPRNLRSPLQELDTQALTDMPSNMTMHKPGPRIIRNKRNNNPPIRRQHGDIPPRRIAKVKIIDIIVAEDLRRI